MIHPSRLHRGYVGCFLAMLLPLAVSWHWILGIPLAWGLWRSCSFTAWAAAGVALVVLEPRLGYACGIAALGLAAASWSTWATPRDQHRARGSLADRVLWRGSSLDGLRARLISWLYLGQRLTWRGHGAGSADRALHHAFVRSGGLGMQGAPVRNDPLQLLYEYGALGAALTLALAVRFAQQLALRDPISAAIAAGIVGMCGASILRHPLTGATWLALGVWAVI